MIVFIIIYIVILSNYLWKKPTVFVCGYIIMTTNFFGLIPVGQIYIDGTELNFFLLNIVCLIGSLKEYYRLNPVALKIISFIAIFYLYGILRPVLLGEQSIFLSIKASKSFSYYFFFFYVLSLYKRINFNTIFSLIYKLACYFSIIYIIDLIVSLSPVLLGYEKESSYNIQCRYDSYIYLALGLINSGVLKIPVKNRIFSNMLLLAGIAIGGYFSLLFCAICILICSYVLERWKRFSIGVKIVLGTILILSSSVFIVSFISIDSIVQTRLDAISSRDRYNETRVLLIGQQILWGYGFLSQNSKLVMGTMSDSAEQYSMGLSFMDSGYIDLAGRFGILGTIIFLLYPIYALVKLYNTKYLLLVFVIISLYAINWTWSVFSFPMGIIIISLIFGFMMKNKYSN